MNGKDQTQAHHMGACPHQDGSAKTLRTQQGKSNKEFNLEQSQWPLL